MKEKLGFGFVIGLGFGVIYVVVKLIALIMFEPLGMVDMILVKGSRIDDPERIVSISFKVPHQINKGCGFNLGLRRPLVQSEKEMITRLLRLNFECTNTDKDWIYKHKS